MTLDDFLERAARSAPTAEDLAALDLADPDLRDALDELRAVHAEAAGPWSALNLHDDERCAIALFAVSAGEVIPLHDHPGMTVHQRVLRGALEVDAWELVSADGTARHHGATLWDVAAGVATIAPGAGGLHRVRALRDAVFLDVLAPPYGETRRCTEWRVVEAADGDGRGRLAPVRTLG